MYPDMILLGTVLTMDPGHPREGGVATVGEKITAIGTRGEISALAGPATKVIDAGKATVLPGFVESHLHLVLGGAELAQLHIGGVSGLAAMRDAFATYSAANPDTPILMAQGAGYDIFDHPTTRADLDAVLADRPIAIMAADHHTVWANTAALEAAGLLHGAAMPHGHEVVLGEDDQATGELREFEAFAPVIALGGEARLHLGIATGGEPDPWPGDAEQAIDRAKVAKGLAHCAAHGITSIVNMDGNLYTLTLLARIRQEGGLTARVKVPFHFKPDMESSELERAEAMRREFDDEWLSSGFVKFFMDGVVDSRTAYMLNDYPGHPGHRAEPLFSPRRFAEVATEVDRRGMQIAVHAIGDGAVRTTIDGMEAAQKANGRRISRHRIEHIELIDGTDVPRLGALGITASLQPAHAPGAMDFPIEPTMNIYAPDRQKDAYLCRDLRDAGAHLAFASDWPVADVSVLRGIKAALTRPTYAGATDQRIDLDAVLRAYTAGGAWAAHMDHVTGTLKPGLAADIVVLSDNIETTDPQDIDTLHVALTVAGGRITHER
ncbi:amidohydrolase [Mesorhizobium xinjiangense]|uniref:amidohydrolase n=1 Tax=Mesorhizobium xinjiangense TaxID=2678685 RepID=UPI0012ED4571|nr:amidohydrolase [Mesorhizobium xinjiangense]